MSEAIPPGSDESPEESPHQEPGGYAPSVAERFDMFSRAGGAVLPRRLGHHPRRRSLDGVAPGVEANEKRPAGSPPRPRVAA